MKIINYETILEEISILETKNNNIIKVLKFVNKKLKYNIFIPYFRKIKFNLVYGIYLIEFIKCYNHILNNILKDIEQKINDSLEFYSNKFCDSFDIETSTFYGNLLECKKKILSLKLDK